MLLLALVAALLTLDPGVRTAVGQDGTSVTGVAVISDAGDDNTYALGEVIRVTLTFSQAVDVTGSPRLKIDMDPAHWGEKWAVYESGSGTAVLTFAHTVVEPNYSTRGVAVLADSLELNGGTIRSASSQTCRTPEGTTTPTTRWTGGDPLPLLNPSRSPSRHPNPRWIRSRHPSPAGCMWLLSPARPSPT